MQHPIILIDGMSLVFRAYHGLQRTAMASPTGEPSFAVFAFANMLLSILDKHKPECIAVVFDTREPTFRHLMYDQYKAHRDAFPEDLVPQLGRIKSLITMMGLAQVELPGYEADDIIGTIARRESADGHDVLCVTSDKDYFQLVTPKVHILRPGKDVGEYVRYDAAGVKEKFGVGPEHVIDVLALIGDASDNVPGVKGVGEKTAIPLIEQFDTVENLYENLSQVERAAVRTKLEAGHDMALLSKTLVTIHTDVPIDAKRDALVCKEYDYKGLDTLCEEMGFHTLRKRFASRNPGAVSATGSPIEAGTVAEAASTMPTYATIANTPHDYILVHTQDGLNEMVAELQSAPELSFDLETTSLDAMQCAIVGISLCAVEGRAFYIAVDDPADAPEATLFDDTPRHDTELLPVAVALAAVKPLLLAPGVKLCGQNAKYDALILKRYGIELDSIAFDTMLASYILDADNQHNMDALSERWLQYKPVSITELIGAKKSQQKSMRDVELSVIRDYAAEDADVTLKLMHKLAPALQAAELTPLAETIEFPLIPVLVTMECNGIRIDPDALGDLGSFMRLEAARLEKEIWSEAGQEFNVASNKQLGEILFEKMMLPTGKKTKTGYSTDVSVLSELATSYPIAQLILDYRQVEKLRSTYVESLPRLINPRTQRVHTTYNQTVAATGRLSSTDPNLQNIPIRSELGLRIRKAFVPQREGSVIMSADYSQIELRIMAAYTQDTNLLAAFSSGADVHAATAAVLFDTPLDAVTGDQRRTAKTVNFGIMYGLGAFGLAQRLGISRTEGQAIISQYFAKYSGIKTYIDETIESTRARGYASTMMGRRRHFPMIQSSNRVLRTAAERAAINTPIQGTAADMMKLAMIRVHDRMRKEGFASLMMLQVHDELVFEARLEELDALTAAVKEEMELALPLHNVPVVVEAGHGASWFEAH